MKNTTFNQNIYLEYPDDFNEMSEEELNKYFASEMLRFGVRNSEKHVALSVAKTKDSFLNLITDAQSVLCGAENSLKKNLKDFAVTETFDAEMLGKVARGMGFEYSANDTGVKQFCEMTVVKGKRCFYVVYCACKLDDAQDNKVIFQAFRSSMKTL